MSNQSKIILSDVGGTLTQLKYLGQGKGFGKEVIIKTLRVLMAAEAQGYDGRIISEGDYREWLEHKKVLKEAGLSKEVLNTFQTKRKLIADAKRNPEESIFPRVCAVLDDHPESSYISEIKKQNPGLIVCNPDEEGSLQNLATLLELDLPEEFFLDCSSPPTGGVSGGDVYELPVYSLVP